MKKNIPVPGGGHVGCAVSSVLITPPMGTSLAGYFTDRKAKGVYDDLYAKILLIKKGPSMAIIIACDLIGVYSGFTFPIREAISREIHIPLSSIMISATHTHTGPVMSGDLANQDYLNDISRKIIKETVAASQKLESCLIEYGSGELKGYAFNRRYLMKDGKVLTNPGIGNLNVLKPAAEVDYSVNVIKIKSSNSIKALVVNTALHGDTIQGNMVSSDWPGYLTAHVKEALGPKEVLVLNGSAGDINHFDVIGKSAVQNINEAKRIGRAYAEKVIDICRHTIPLEVETVGGASEKVEVPVRKIKKGDITKAEKIIREFENRPKTKRDGPLESQAIAEGGGEVMVYFAKNLLSVSEKYKNSFEGLEFQLIRLGELAMVGLGGEVFTEIGLRIKRNKIFKHTIIAELVNGCAGYLPTKKAFKEGGYETMPREENKIGEDVEEIILKTVNRLLKQMSKRRE